MIAARLGGAVGAVRRIRRLLAERRILRSQRTKDLVGRDVQETRIADHALRSVPESPGGFEQAEGSNEIRLDELLRIVDRAVHVRLGGKVHHRINRMLPQQRSDQVPVADVAADKHVPRVRLHRGETGAVSRIGELVKRHHTLDFHAKIAAGIAQKVMDQIRADESGSAGDKDSHDGFGGGMCRASAGHHENHEPGGSQGIRMPGQSLADESPGITNSTQPPASRVVGTGPGGKISVILLKTNVRLICGVQQLLTIPFNG